MNIRPAMSRLFLTSAIRSNLDRHLILAGHLSRIIVRRDRTAAKLVIISLKVPSTRLQRWFRVGR